MYQCSVTDTRCQRSDESLRFASELATTRKLSLTSSCQPDQPLIVCLHATTYPWWITVSAACESLPLCSWKTPQTGNASCDVHAPETRSNCDGA